MCICTYIHAYIHASWIFDLLCWILLVCSHWIFECSVSVANFAIKQSNSVFSAMAMSLAPGMQPIAVAAERSKTKLIADPSTTVMDLYQSLDRWLTSQSTNDLVATLKCLENLTEQDSPTKYGPVFLDLKVLLMDLLLLAPNCVLPRLRLNEALKRLNGDRRWNFAHRSLCFEASRIEKQIRSVFRKLRDIVKYSEVFHRFVAKVSVPNEFVAQSHRTRINSDQW